jgi:hypothetical protein
VDGLPIEMRKPRQARRGWFYINPATIDVVHDPKSEICITTLTRRQLEAALRVMNGRKQ